jgi:hypothetical protein
LKWKNIDSEEFLIVNFPLKRVGGSLKFSASSSNASLMKREGEKVYPKLLHLSTPLSPPSGLIRTSP